MNINFTDYYDVFLTGFCIGIGISITFNLVGITIDALFNILQGRGK